MGIEHKYKSNKPDTVPGVVKPSHWNARHNHPEFMIWCASGATGTFWVVPEKRHEFGNQGSTVYPPFQVPTARTRYDFTLCSNTWFRTKISNGPPAKSPGATVQMEYSENADIWAPISHPLVIGVPANQGLYKTLAFPIPAAAKKLVWVRLVGFGGHPAGDISLEFDFLGLYTD